MISCPCNKETIRFENGGEAHITDLSIGFLLDIENGSKQDDVMSILHDASDLEDDAIKKLTNSEAKFVVENIMKLTYGDISEDNSSKGEEKK